MKRHLLLIPMILATTAAIADAEITAPSRVDAQAQAAALLSQPHAPEAARTEARSPSPSHVQAALDAHESAAVLLSGARPRQQANTVSAVVESPRAPVSMDAHAQAAALLSGSRPSALQTKRVGVGEPTIGRVF
jgi:hypothetical protein